MYIRDLETLSPSWCLLCAWITHICRYSQCSTGSASGTEGVDASMSDARYAALALHSGAVATSFAA